MSTSVCVAHFRSGLNASSSEGLAVVHDSLALPDVRHTGQGMVAYQITSRRAIPRFGVMESFLWNVAPKMDSEYFVKCTNVGHPLGGMCDILGLNISF